MIPIVVPDVNVLLSGTIISQYAPSQIMQAWRKDQIEIATSEPILEDLRRAFTYPRVIKFTKVTQSEANSYIEFLKEAAMNVAGTIPVNISPDPDDNKLFSCAIEASADYIVSTDKKHVLSVGEYQGIVTLHPSDFVKEVLKQRGS